MDNISHFILINNNHIQTPTPNRCSSAGLAYPSSLINLKILQVHKKKKKQDA